MKIYRAGHKIIFCLIFLFTLQKGICAQENNQPFSINESPLPAPTGFINDYAGVIDAGVKARLEQRLTNFKNANNPPIELAVAIVRTTGGRVAQEYSLAVARGWKIGSKEDDNPGALLFVAIDDKKYFTQVSRDLEDELPDGLVGQLQRQYLVPAFKQGNYNKGVEDTLEAYIRAIEQRTSGTTVPANGQTNQQQPQQQPRGRNTSSLSTIGCCVIGLVILLILIFSRSGRSGRGGGFGGGGFGGGSALPWIIGSILANSASSRGSDWGGSSSWGGGGDSGGWGGFGGGGDFGGGGAGGDW